MVHIPTNSNLPIEGETLIRNMYWNPVTGLNLLLNPTSKELND
jgi:hypothetical protein